MALFNGDVSAETKDDQRFRDHLTAKYEKKRWPFYLVSFFLFFFAAEMAGIDFRTSFTQLLFSCYHFVRIFQNGIQVFD